MAAQIYCSNCGQMVSSESNYCRFCGAPQHGAEARSFRVGQPAIDVMHEKPSTSAESFQLEYMPRQHLGQGAFMGFFLSFLAKTGLLLVLGGIGAALMPRVFVPFLVAYLLLVAIAAMLMYNNFFFQIDDDGLTIEQGIIHKNQVTVPFDQIQNVNIERTLLDRILGVSRVSIETAGSAAAVNGTKPKAEAYLPGIDMAFAKKIHDLLIDAAEAANKG